MTAAAITSDIKWLLSDAGLDKFDPKVKTSRREDRWETVVRNVSADRAKEALSLYLDGTPESTAEPRKRDGALVVTQPVR